MKKVLLQLDTDPHPSPFDAIVAHDAGIDVLLPCGDVAADDVRDLVHGAIFTRGPDDLANTAVWVGGSDARAGEAVLGKVREAFFGPFQVSVMLDSDGCNTTAAAAVLRLVRERDLDGARAAVVGLGPVGLRAAALLGREGCDVVAVTIPADVLGTDSYRRPRGLATAQEMGIETVEPGDRGELEAALDGAAVIVAAGPASVQLLSREAWSGLDDAELLADCNAAEPVGLEGVEPTDDLVERDGKRVLGALAIGGLKMKVHKACVRRLFEANDHVLDADGVYAVAKEID